jgi:hypothetical protein
LNPGLVYARLELHHLSHTPVLLTDFFFHSYGSVLIKVMTLQIINSCHTEYHIMNIFVYIEISFGVSVLPLVLVIIPGMNLLFDVNIQWQQLL